MNLLSDNDSGTVELDFSGSGPNWKLFSVNLGGDSVNYASETGVAILNCDVDSSTTDRFTLYYAAHVAMDDLNNFGCDYWRIDLEDAVAEGRRKRAWPVSLIDFYFTQRGINRPLYFFTPVDAWVYVFVDLLYKSNVSQLRNFS